MIYDFLKERILKFQNSTVKDENTCISYKELIERAESLGKTLKYDKYGVLCKSELDTAISLLACFYAKKVAIPLSYRYGDKHNQKIINKIQVAHIITESGIEKVSDEQEETEDLTDVAVIMCTSGTTGVPKGAMITYENLMTNLNDISLYFDISNSDKILISRPLYHCAVLTGEFLSALIKGTNIVFLNSEFNPLNILNALRENDITVFCGTPTILYYLCNTIRKNKELSLKTVVVSGECMTEAVANRIIAVFPKVNVYHVYGLTEASPRVSYLSPDMFEKHPLSVGVPLASIKVKFEDGELLVEGKSIMKGYYNDLDSTRKVIKNGWLHTGDMADIDAEGRIIIKSRKDSMIIRAGMNIYPPEIENKLKSIDAIKDVLAYGIKNDAVSEKICLKVVTDNLSKAAVYNYCKELLSSYQLPDIIDLVDEIPRNASGKIIRGIDNTTGDKECIEAEVRKLVCEALELSNTDDILPDDDLVLHGMDSLNSIALIINIEELYGIEISDEQLGVQSVSSINKICGLIRSYIINKE